MNNSANKYEGCYTSRKMLKLDESVLKRPRCKVTACTGGPSGWPGYAVAYPKPALFLLMNFFDCD